ncbi:MAG: MFS transporter [Clostridia bacterium]|nr:MFS transporter [Clostridia bacterium]
MTDEKKQSAYKWVIAAISFLMVATSLGFCSGNKSLYLKAITEALGIERRLFSISDSFRYITTAILNLFFGVQIAKMGPKKMILAGFAALIVSCLLYSVGTSIAVFYLAGIFLGVGIAWCTTTVVGFVIGKWFTEHRGTVMGIVMAANGLGVAVAAQIISPMIDSGTFGYRRAYWVTAAVLGGVALLALLFFRDEPKGYTGSAELPTGKKKQPKRARRWDGIDYDEAKRKPYFWVMALCVFMIGVSVQAASGHTVAHLKDIGLDPVFVTNVWSFHGLTLACAKILAGYCFDKFGLKITMLFCEILGAISIFLLALSTAATPVLAAIGATAISFALPLESSMLPLLAADMFGEKSYAKIMGMVVAFSTAGHAIGAPLTDQMFEMSNHSYKVIFIIYAVTLVAIAVAFEFLLRRSDRERSAILAAKQEQ